MLSKEEIKKLTNEVNDLFRERNYFKTIMDGYSHVSDNIVKPKHDGGNPKYEDKKDFMYPTVFEYDESWERGKKDKYKATFIYDSKTLSSGLPCPDSDSKEEYQDFERLIDYKKEEGSELFFGPSGSGKKELECTNSEGNPMWLKGDMLFHFDQPVNHLLENDRKKAFSRLRKPSQQLLINTFIKASALSGNYIFWRNAGRGKGINIRRSNVFQSDRPDLALEVLRRWFGSGSGDNREYQSLLDAFDEEQKAGYPLFSKEGDSDHWGEFVDFFELEGSFVREGDFAVYNQVSNLSSGEMEVFSDDSDLLNMLKDSWSDPKLGEGIPPEIENYLINGIKTIIERTKSLNKILPRA